MKQLKRIAFNLFMTRKEETPPGYSSSRISCEKVSNFLSVLAGLALGAGSLDLIPVEHPESLTARALVVILLRAAVVAYRQRHKMTKERGR